MCFMIFKKYVLIGLLLFFVLFSQGCIPSELPPRVRTLDMYYNVDDSFLKVPPSDITSPGKGFHTFNEGQSVVLSSSSNVYGIGEWSVKRMSAVQEVVYKQPSVDLVIDDDYRIFADIHCLVDDACQKGFVCEDSVCVEDVFTFENFSGTYEDDDFVEIGPYSFRVVKIGESAVICEFEEERKIIQLDDYEYFDSGVSDFSLGVFVDDIRFDWFAVDNCDPFVESPDSGVIVGYPYYNQTDSFILSEESFSLMHSLPRNLDHSVTRYVFFNGFIFDSDFDYPLLNISYKENSVSNYITLGLGEAHNISDGVISYVDWDNSSQNASVIINHSGVDEDFFEFHDEFEIANVALSAVGIDGDSVHFNVGGESVWIDLDDSVFFEEYDLELFLMAIFHKDKCGYTMKNKEVDLRFFSD